ncbi:MAG: AAA+ family ATPase, partial [Acidimicrobiales bacterium]
AEAEHLGWASVVSESDSLGLSKQQHEQAAARATEARSTVDLRLADAYQWLLVPRQPEPTGPIVWDEVKADGEGRLAERAGRRLVQTGGLYTTYPPVLLRLHLDGPLEPLWESGSVSVNQVWEACARYLYLHRLRDLNVLLACVAGAPASTVWAGEGFAVAEAVNPRRPGRFVGLAAGGMAADARGTTLLVRPAVAEIQLAEDRSVELPVDAGGAGSEVQGPIETQDGTTGGVVLQRRARRFYGVVAADPDRLGRDAGRVAQEIVAHLQGLVGTETEVTIEIRATNAEGFSETVVKIVSENAAALRFKDHGFESS